MAIRKQPAATSRPRNAQATRAAILEAARTCFTEAGYEHVGVRDVATRAGVNGALVIRYFGSKMKLFAEAVAGRFAFDAISDGHALDGNRMARVVLERKERGGRVNAVLALVRSAPDPQAAAILKRGLEDDFIKPLAASLHGRQAHQRAALITAYLLGLAIARDVVGVGALADSADEKLLALVAPVIQSYIDPAGIRARKPSAPNHKQPEISKLNRARRMVVSDPDIRAGEPVVKGTRIPVHLIAEILEKGGSESELADDYRLSPEQIDLAVLYAKAYPRHGRPPKLPSRRRRIPVPD